MKNAPAPKVALTMIIKDDSEAKVLERGLKQYRKHFDALYITGTNKPDTEIKKLTYKYDGHYSFFKWTHDFSEARQFNLEQVPKDEYPFIFWMDADDVLFKGEQVRDMAIQAELSGLDAIYIPYYYQVDVDEEGNVREVVTEHLRERLVRNDGSFKWVGPLHETLIEQRQTKKVNFPEPVVVHLSSPERMEKNLDRNVKILEETIRKQDRRDPRTIMYLAKAYFDMGKMAEGKEREVEFDKARLLFDEYLNGSGEVGTKDYREGSGWTEERAQAWAYLSEIYRLLGHLNSAIQCSANSLISDPKMPNYYLDMAMTYCLMEKWDYAEHWLMLASHVDFPLTTMIVNKRDVKARKLEIAYQIARATNNLEAELKAAKGLMDTLPHIQPIRQRYEITKLKDKVNRFAQSLVYMVKYYEESGQTEKIPALLQAIPEQLEGEPFVSEMRQRFLPSRVWDENEIAIFCGPGFEQWSPLSLNRDGIGGSEEAVIRLGRHLAKKGWKVTVYANPLDEAGEYDGVTYKQYHEFNAKDTFNIMIFWRAVGMVDIPVSAKQKYLWLHDIPNSGEFTEERVKKLDKIFVLSEFHKSLLKFNVNGEFVDPPEGKVVVSANGIDTDQVPDGKDRNPKRMIYTSSYDRGLEYLLKNWDEIKERVPDAELDICYGWNLFDKAWHNNPAKMMWKQKISHLMEKDGITHRGRLGQDKVVELTGKAGIWAYPTAFGEISCISAMKAQAYGAVPVVTDYAALKETVQHGDKVDVDITSKKGQAEFVDHLVTMLQNEDEQNKIREDMQKWAAEKFSWANVADQWDSWFKEDAKNATISLI